MVADEAMIEMRLLVHAVPRPEREVHATHALERTNIAYATVSRESPIHAEAELTNPYLTFVGSNHVENPIELARGAERLDNAAALDHQRDGIRRHVESERGVGEAIDLHATVYALEIARFGEHFSDGK